jgi:hypothetical protein
MLRQGKAGPLLRLDFASHQLEARLPLISVALRTDLGSYLRLHAVRTLCFAAALLVMWIGVDWRRAKPVAGVETAVASARSDSARAP